VPPTVEKLKDWRSRLQAAYNTSKEVHKDELCNLGLKRRVKDGKKKGESGRGLLPDGQYAAAYFRTKYGLKPTMRLM